MKDDDIRTLVMTRKVGTKFVLSIDGQPILDVLVVSIGKKEVSLSFRTSERVKISAIKNWFKHDPKVQ